MNATKKGLKAWHKILILAGVAVISFICGVVVTIGGYNTTPKTEANPTNPPAKALAPLPTYTLYPTYTAQVFVIKDTPTSKPIEPTATFEVVTLPTSAPIDPATSADRGEGTYLVGSEVAVGKWRTTGGDCYAVSMDENGESNDLVTGKGSILTVGPKDFQVKFVSYPDTCTWSYIGK